LAATCCDEEISSSLARFVSSFFRYTTKMNAMSDAVHPQQDSHQEEHHQPPPPPPMPIQSLPVESVRRIMAGQAILDLAGCVKELVDNALDAGSTNINST
jgi:hypothetical protein